MQMTIDELSERPEVMGLLNAFEGTAQAVIEEALRIQAIAAPTFEETARAAYVERRFREIGLVDVTRDDVQNVYGRTAGSSGGPGVLVSAHLDTVFPAQTELTVRHAPDEGRIYGPGLGDNSLGLAGMIALAEAVTRQGVVPPCDVLWVATVGEEGLGDLRGMRRAVERLGAAQASGQIGVGIVLEGIGLGRVYHAGLGVRRLRVAVDGPGGHSWLHADTPSAVHHLLRVGGALVAGVTPPQQPRTSFNIGVIAGGTSINTRAAEAHMEIDMRSVDAGALRAIEQQVRAIIAQTPAPPELAVTVEVVGDRPSATLPRTHPLVRATQDVLVRTGTTPAEPEIGSTDANILLASGIPSVCVGISTGGSAHTREEYIDTAPAAKGMRHLALLTMLAAEHIGTWQNWGAT